MFKFTFKIADSNAEDLKPLKMIQVTSDTLSNAKTKADTALATGYRAGSLMSCQEVLELPEDEDE